MTRTSWMCALLGLVVACRSRGTIEVSFGPAPMDCVDGDEQLVLYAQPDIGCGLCECGACFGMPGGRDGCDGICEVDADGSLAAVELDLDPGRWAIVLAMIDPQTGLEHVHGCVEVDVDADGISSPPPLVGELVCESCEP